MFSKIQTRLAKNRVILTIYHVHHISTTNHESRNFIEVWWLYLHFYLNINKQSHCHKKKSRFIDSGFGCWHVKKKIIISYDRKQFIFTNMFLCHNRFFPTQICTVCSLFIFLTCKRRPTRGGMPGTWKKSKVRILGKDLLSCCFLSFVGSLWSKTIYKRSVFKVNIVLH